MRVTLDLTRGDIARFNLSKMFTLKANLYTFGFAMFMALAIAFLNVKNEATGPGWSWFFVFTAVGGAFIFIVIFAISLVFVLINSTVMSGALGEHTFTIEEAGLREQTAANDSMHYWHALKKAEKTRAAIFVQINPWLFHVLPRRGFDDDHAYDAFFAGIETRMTS